MQTPTILGLDISSKTIGWGLLGQGPILLAHGHFNPLSSKFSFMQRLCDVSDCITELCKKFQPTKVAVEDIIQHMSGGGSMAQTITILAAFNRVAALAAWRCVEDVTFYPVATIRKIIRQEIKRKERIEKGEMPTIIRKHLCSKFSDVFSKKGSISKATMDEADGIAVAWACFLRPDDGIRNLAPKTVRR